VDFGFLTFPTEYTMPVAHLAQAVEAAGFESLFFPEHTHIPASRDTPFPGGGDLPREYSHCLDPFVALAAAASVTSRLRVGTGVCLVVQRDPIVTAKEVATLDLVSGGRMLFGVGAGWNREEMANHGTDPRTRTALLTERVRAMQEIWTRDEAEFHGDFVDFDPIWSWPKPVQHPHPPVLIGGNGPTVHDRVLEVGDEWAPLLSRDIGGRISELADRADQAGRPPVPVTVFAAPAKEEVLTDLAERGVHRCVFNLKPGDTTQTTDRIGRYAELAARFA
jgi:probable F420-dependent oxidoreductase